MGTGKRGCCESCAWILRLGEAGGARSESICWQSRAWRLNPAFCPYNNYHHPFIRKTLMKLSCALHARLRPSAACRAEGRTARSATTQDDGAGGPFPARLTTAAGGEGGIC